MEENHHWSAIIGIIIILVVGFNILFVFSDMFGIGKGAGLVTGYTTLECHPSAEGIICGSDIYPNAEWNGCEEGVIACTNACEIARIKINDDRICPSYCTDFCVSPEIAELINKRK